MGTAGKSSLVVLPIEVFETHKIFRRDRIYKSKYMDHDEQDSRIGRAEKKDAAGAAEKKKQPRDKSKTRSIFGRKKSMAAPST